MVVPSPATSATVSSERSNAEHIWRSDSIQVCVQAGGKHELLEGIQRTCFPTSKHSNLSSNISKCSGLRLDLPLSMQAVGVSRGHRLSHSYFRASTINPQQVLPCLLWDLTIVCTWKGGPHMKRKGPSTICFSLLLLLRFTLLELYVSSFH